MCESLRPPRGEQGTALIAVIIISLLVAASAITTWQLGRARHRAATARAAREQAAWAARGAVRIAVGWFEAAERGSVVAPPGIDAVSRERRIVDDDGDGSGLLWSDESGARKVRYKESDARLFRPPDDGALEHRFVGTAEGPDLVIEREGVESRAVLDALGAAIALRGTTRVTGVRVFAPAPGSGPGVLATVEVLTETPRPGGAPARAVARADAWRIDWDRPERPLVVAGSLELAGDASWRFGEALVGGSLVASPATVATWPAGIPWLAPDRPLRDDNDGDGIADDADGDGIDDLELWRVLPGVVADPWWRARVAGGWSSVAPAPSACGPALPFGPRRTPPDPPSKTDERSGVMVGCPVASLEPVPEAWLRLAGLGVRGAARALPDPDDATRFVLAGSSRAGTTLGDLLGQVRGALAVDPPSGTAAAPLVVEAQGQSGALLAPGRDVVVRPSATTTLAPNAPDVPRDTQGVERAPSSADDWLDLAPAGLGCALGFDPGAWTAASSGSPPGVLTCEDEAWGFVGLLAASGSVTLESGVRVLGQVRAGSARLDGTTDTVLVRALPDGTAAAPPRGGPPGAPRVVPLRVRGAP